MLQGGNYAVRRDALGRAGGYDTSVVFYGEDTVMANRLIRVGRVRFSLLFTLRTSGRRLRREGIVATASRYAFNGLSAVVHGRPGSSRYTDVRER
jgi:hypothetical protein